MTLQRPNFLARWAAEHARVGVASLGRLWRDPFSTLLTALVIGLTLSLPAGLQLLVDNLQAAAGGLQQTRTVMVYLRDSTSPDAGAELAADLAAREGIGAAHYTSREQALKDFREQTDLAPVLDALGENPLPASIAIIPGEDLGADDLQAIAQEMIGHDAVETVQQDSAWSARLSAALGLASRLALLLAIALGTAAVLAMGNTIRLDIESRRREILVMKLIGAPASFIRRPFLYAGFWYGLAGGAVAVVAIYIARAAMGAPVSKLVALYDGAFAVQGPDPRLLLSVIGAGIVLGLAGAWLALARHLGRIELR